MASTVKKGNKLEDKFYEYLVEQQSRDDFVYGVYPADHCKIFKKKKYYCGVRKSKIEFDVVIEVFRKEASSPHLFVIFECKNHGRSIEEDYINAFSKKLGRMFEHTAKGVVVTSSRLQVGADNVAKNSGMGIVKYDEHGFEVIAERKSGPWTENVFIKTQIFKDEPSIKPLKFSACYGGKYFGSINQFLRNLDQLETDAVDNVREGTGASIPFISNEEIQKSAQAILSQIDYLGGIVDLRKICLIRSIDLSFSEHSIFDDGGNSILGSANFDSKSIQIYSHDNKQRERFTIAHEIGHFCLQHGRYLRSETIVERDLLTTSGDTGRFNYERLEVQANAFASHLLLPADSFRRKVAECREILGIKNRGFGYIFVDDQPGNFQAYVMLLSNLSTYFDVSKQAIEIKLKNMKMLTDQRRQSDSLSISQLAAISGSQQS